ncbi:prophage Lp2 protein 22 [Desulfocucumis palustris]|uniref:Prophage Lp2 protein 22 n=1 Tax=Desulfocucumis palustris TaxID=1898651 RepID=A0A2L2XDM1_9FIRM|nr:prophage Lp2 protein 22 [Desulfocucumis palustris]
MVYRAHRYEEKDWISYTLDQAIATRFARERKVNEISLYRLRRRDVIALFLRRGEQEIIMLQTERAKLIEKMLL